MNRREVAALAGNADRAVELLAARVAFGGIQARMMPAWS
jgi:hypothetical protein